MPTKNVTSARQRASGGILPGAAQAAIGAAQESRMRVWPAFARGPTALSSDRQAPSDERGVPSGAPLRNRPGTSQVSRLHSQVTCVQDDWSLDEGLQPGPTAQLTRDARAFSDLVPGRRHAYFLASYNA